MKRLVLFLLFFTVSLAYAQDDRGSISGLVTDSTGAVIPNAAITITNEATGIVLNTTSDGAGSYNVGFVIPGVYTVSVANTGFKQYTATHVRVEVAGHVGINAKLSVGATNEVVTVQGTGGARLDTQDATLGFTVEGRSAQELPLLYSNPFELQLLAPGVNSTTLNSGTHTYEGGPRAPRSTAPSPARQSSPSTAHPTPATAEQSPLPTFPRKDSSASSAHHLPLRRPVSHTSGGSIDASLKSGTSQFHGGVSWYFQPQGVDSPAFSLRTQESHP